MAPEKVSVLVVGAGPTGLGAATRLHQHGLKNWLLIDQADEAGGLACTDVTPEGFLFDMGGHVIFSHYQYFDGLIEEAVGKGDDFWNTLERVSYVWICDRWVAYPFQNNIAALPKEEQIKCLTGVAEAKVVNATAQTKPKDFDEWIMRVQGKGIADLFMRPYNFKVWAYPTTEMQCEWLGERVATVDISRAINNVILDKEDAGWGPNAVFRFPLEGGTGAIWKKVAKLLPESNQKYGKDYEMTKIDKEKQIVTLKNGQQIEYGALITTTPLDLTLQWLGKGDLANRLEHSSSHIIGIGIRGECPHGLKCWLYYPEDNCPFYRITVFSHYAPKNTPDANAKLPTLCYGDASDAKKGEEAKAGPYWSLMFEISESKQKPVNQKPISLGGGTWAEIVKETIVGSLNTKMVAAKDEIVSIYHRRLEHGYPTPHLNRDAALAEALPFLRDHNIWSRGRFGSWKYEVGNQDHSLMLGVECADNVLFGTKELTLNHPNIVNQKKNMELLYGPKTFLGSHTQ
jgi:protoporphyrinogen oxidase